MNPTTRRRLSETSQLLSEEARSLVVRNSAVTTPVVLKVARLASIAATVLIAPRLYSQEVFVNPPPMPALPAAPSNPVLTDDVTEMEDGEEQEGSGLLSAILGRNWLNWGPARFHPGVNYDFRYSTGIRNRPGSEKESIVQTVSPHLRVDLGKRWFLSYTPELRFYSNEGFEDTLSHSANLSGSLFYNDWFFGISQGYSRDSSPRAETAQQSDSESYDTSLSASRQLSRDWSLQLGFSQGFSFRGGYANAQSESRSWSTMNWLNYQLAPGIGIGAGAGGGYVALGEGSDMTFQQLQGRISAAISQKVSLSLNGGAEIRQFVDSDRDPMINPVMGAAISYSPFDATRLTLSADRSISSSYFQNSVNQRTSLTLTLSQRLLSRLNLGLSGGYNVVEYESTQVDAGTTRSDENYNFRASLSTSFLRRGTASVYYAINQHSSDETGYDFSSKQIGFSIGWSY